MGPFSKEHAELGTWYHWQQRGWTPADVAEFLRLNPMVGTFESPAPVCVIPGSREIVDEDDWDQEEPHTGFIPALDRLLDAEWPEQDVQIRGVDPDNALHLGEDEED
ncbi:hypothetical protein FOMPIDRAFT_92370 [Fomitopsis schrenkii]|uniref:Uncharacterized protein n=1 Tax=Fomitopsis schrenkii TaxID=2126942 RepID=S8DML6_FOMSC|nr:hypothetical protein FOMPIDRAFT_92370 [Fomitopsis schrenkii]